MGQVPHTKTDLAQLIPTLDGAADGDDNLLRGGVDGEGVGVGVGVALAGAETANNLARKLLPL